MSPSPTPSLCFLSPPPPRAPPLPLQFSPSILPVLFPQVTLSVMDFCFPDCCCRCVPEDASILQLLPLCTPPFPPKKPIHSYKHKLHYIAVSLHYCIHSILISQPLYCNPKLIEYRPVCGFWYSHLTVWVPVHSH